MSKRLDHRPGRSLLFRSVVHLSLALSLLVSTGPAESADFVEGYLTLPEGIRLFYVKGGSGPRIVILPGRFLALRDFRWLADEYTLVAYDMRGRGRSDLVLDGKRITIEHDALDLEAIRRHFGIETFSALGYSYLGKVIAMYSIQHPWRVERLVQLGPVPLVFGTRYASGLEAAEGDTFVTPEDRARLRSLREKSYHLTHPQEYCEEEWKVQRVDLLGDPARAPALGPGPCDMPNEWPTLLVRHMRFAFEESAMKHALPRESVAGLRMPVLTVHGTRDRNAPYGAGREWSYLLPEGRLLTIEGGAHQAFSEFGDKVMPAVRQFLAGRWPEGAEKVAADPRATP